MNGDQRINKVVQRLNQSDLSVDITVQQPLNPRWVKDIADNFDEAFLGTIIVSRRPDGTYIVLDGQHRLAAAKAAGYVEQVDCLVYTGLTLAEEAALFLNFNRRKVVRPIDRFRVRVVEGDKDATTINNILHTYGWKLSAYKGTYMFCAVQAIETVYNGAGVERNGPRPDLVDSTMFTITNAWSGEGESVHNTIVGGVGQVFARYGTEVDRAALADRLSKVQPNTLISKTRALRDARKATSSAAMGEVIVGEYNTRRTVHRLADWRWVR